MFVDLLSVAVIIAFLTVVTATKKNAISQLKKNSITSGILLTLFQLIVFITRLEFNDEKIYDVYKLVISVLVKFRPLLIGFVFSIIFKIVEGILNKQNFKTDDKADITKPGNGPDFSVLSRREIEVARLAAKGYTNAQIAETLFISSETVKRHMATIIEKLNISSRKELMLKE